MQDGEEPSPPLIPLIGPCSPTKAVTVVEDMDGTIPYRLALKFLMDRD
jgi:hypothetical protein